MNCFCGFPLDKSCVCHIDTHYQNKDKQESHIEPLAGKTAGSDTSQRLNVLSDRACGIRDKVQLVGFLYHISRRIGNV